MTKILLQTDKVLISYTEGHTKPWYVYTSKQISPNCVSWSLVKNTKSKTKFIEELLLRKSLGLSIDI